MSASPMSTRAARLRFGRFELQSDERRLLVDGAPTALVAAPSTCCWRWPSGPASWSASTR
jgi:hypothetical protein